MHLSGRSSICWGWNGTLVVLSEVVVEREIKCERVVSNVDQALRCCQAGGNPWERRKIQKNEYSFLHASPAHLRTYSPEYQGFISSNRQIARR